MPESNEGSKAMFKLIQNGEVYTPAHIGTQPILLAGGKIVKVGDIGDDEIASLERLTTIKLGLEVIDAQGCLVVPGFIDPHQHILGASGEEGFSSRSPEVQI